MWKKHKNPHIMRKVEPQPIAEKRPDTGLLLLNPRHKATQQIVNEERLTPLLPILFQYWEYWLRYPDALIDLLKGADTKFDLKPIQRFVLRQMLRKKVLFLTATRGFSKSFIAVFANYIVSILVPRSKQTMCANTKDQVNQIGREKINEIQTLVPLLRNEVRWEKGSQTAFSDEYIRLDRKLTLPIFPLPAGWGLSPC